MGNELQEKSEMARRMEQDGGRQEAVTRALTLIEAAEDLRVSRRWLEYWLADHPVDACVANPQAGTS